MKQNIIITLIILTIGIFFSSCHINPLYPALEELSSGKNYFPLEKYSRYTLKSTNGDTLIISIEKETFQFENYDVYKVVECTKSNTELYDMISNENGVFFYVLGEINPFLKYPLIQDFTWSFKSISYIFIFTVYNANTQIGNYDNVKEISWTYYMNGYNNDYYKTDYYFFKNEIGPVKIIKDNMEYFLKDVK